jgi:hypothetical protein
MLGTPVATLLGLEPGAVIVPALPGIAPAAFDPVPQGRTLPGFTVPAVPDPLTPGVVIVLCPGVRPRGTVGVTGVVIVPVGAVESDGWAAKPTGGDAISPCPKAVPAPVIMLASDNQTNSSRMRFFTGCSPDPAFQ